MKSLTTSATVFTLRNQCTYTVWPGTLSGDGATVIGDGGFELAPGASTSLPAPPNWSGRFWARTGCSFPDSGVNGSCATGDCAGLLRCTLGGSPPVTLAEFTLGGSEDFYDVSIVDGYNVGVGVRPAPTSCRYAGCLTDLNQRCPAELRVAAAQAAGGGVVACRSACDAFGGAEYCCTGTYASPSTCAPTRYSLMFKDACPNAYSYAYDDATSTCTCATGSDYVITFCPSAADT
ncbi:putative Thaumatin family [Dioscorea sansibarensis]